MSEKYVNINENDFDDVIASYPVVLVDFWASWCGPCKMLSPVVEEIAEDYADRILVGKVNVDDNPALAERYGIVSIPALYVFKNGEVREKLIGFRQKAQIAVAIDKNLQ